MQPNRVSRLGDCPVACTPRVHSNHTSCKAMGSPQSYGAPAMGPGCEGVVGVRLAGGLPEECRTQAVARSPGCLVVHLAVGFA